jgi:hypothetical protein
VKRVSLAPAAGARLAAAIVVGLVLMLATVTPAHAANLTPVGAQSFARVAACAKDADHLLASIVVDSSGSLLETDPGAARVQAIQVALDSLQQLTTSRSTGLDVQADLSTFAKTYYRLVGWGPVDGSHGDRLRSTASRELPSRASGGTDYRAALRGAQHSIDGRAASLGGTSCKVVLWFTDGGLDVGPATATARAELCDPQGIVDGLRRDDIALVALALFTPAGGDSVKAVERDRLRAVAEAQGTSERCGTVPVPADAATGAYLRADDAGAIGRLFAQAAALIAGGTAAGSIACPSASCPAGRLEIPVDPGVRGFRLVVDGPGSGATLMAPNGARVPLAAGTSRTLSGNAVTVSRQGELATVDVRMATNGRHRPWVLQTNAETASSVDRYYLWGATIAVSVPKHLTIGERGVVTVRARDFTGAPLRNQDYDGLQLKATVDGRAIAATPSGPAAWTLHVTVPLADAASAVKVDASLAATTAAHHVRLGPVTVERSLVAVLPAYFPSVQKHQLAFPDLVGDRGATSTLLVTGSAKGVTQACFAGASLAGPSAAGAVKATADRNCVTLQPGATQRVTVHVAAAKPADGSVDGRLAIRLRGVHGETATLHLPVTARMVRPVDEPLRWSLVLLLSLAALLIAALTAHAARWISDRFRLGMDARVASVPVVISRSGITRVEPDRQGDLLDAVKDFRHAGMSGASRLSRVAAGGLTYRRSFPWFPLRPAQGWAEADNGDVVVAPTERQFFLRPDGRRAPVSFPGSQGFLLTVQPSSAHADDGELKGRLVLLIDEPGGVASVLEDRIAQVRTTDWDRVTDAVLQAVVRRSSRAKAPAQPKRQPAAPDGRRGTDAPTVPPEPPAAAAAAPPAPDFAWTTTSSRSISWDRDLPGSTSGAPSVVSSPSRSASAPPGRSARSGPSSPPVPTRPSSREPATDEPPRLPSSLNVWD